MASIVPKGKKDLQVAFLEKNGLRHGQFQLRLTDAANTNVQNMAWNSASDILMVHLAEPDYDTVQLWTRSNYHWYLKWNRRFPDRCDLVAFDEENPYLLDVLLQTGAWSEYTFRWDPSSTDRFGTAVVVDGNQLLVTPFEKALIPPPMAAATLSLQAPVVDIVIDRIHSLHGESVFAAVLADGYMAIFGGVDDTASSRIGNYSPPALKALVKLPEEAVHWRSYTMARDASVDRVEFVAVESGSQRGSESLIHFQVSLSSKDSQPFHASISIKDSLPLESCLLTVTPWSDDPDGAVLELIDGELLEFDSAEGAVVPLAEPGVLLEPCPWIAALKHPDQLVHDDSHRRRLVTGRTERGRLFCHDLLLSDSISSFVLDPRHGFLCFITFESRCELRFIPLTGLINFDPLGGLDETLPLLRGYEPRHVERGSTLVTTLIKPSLVLQMPRGNLEGIFPRALVLQRCMKLIHAGEYDASFSLMRRPKSR